MHFVDKDPAQKRKDLNEKLKSNKILRVPGYCIYIDLALMAFIKFVTSKK